MRRGALSLPGLIERVPDGDGMYVERSLGKTDLNYFCLYWDELVIPTNSLIHFELDGESEFIDTGFLKRPRLDHRNFPNASKSYDFMISIQEEVAKKLNKESKSTHWFMNNIGSDDSEIKGGFSSPSLIIELSRVLPVPIAGVHAEDILNFKSHRRSELDAVHELINELYIEVKKSANPVLDEAKSFNRLESAINDLNKSFFERWRESFRYNLSINKDLNANDIYSAVMAMQAVHLVAQNQIVPALIHGATAAIPSVLSRVSFKHNKEKSLDRSKLRYLARASDAGIIRL